MSKRMSEEEKAARAAAREAEQKAARDAYIRKILDDWPPLSDEQIWKIRKLLNIDRDQRAKTGPSAYELEQRRKMQEREEALREAKQIAESMTACDVCNLQPAAHAAQKLSEFGFHDWVPGRAQKVIAQGQRKARAALKKKEQ